jgi:NAD-dependent DNA ligase
MQTYDVVQMKMAEEKIDGLPISFMYISVQFVKTVSGIENNLVIACP